jgi:hypothetical protein
MNPNNRLGTKSVGTLRGMVNDRDLQILHHVREHKFLTTKQIQRLLFWDHETVGAGTRACTRVLSRLQDRRLLYRLQRQIGGVRAGSASYVWGIDDSGDRLLRAESGKAVTKRFRTFEPMPRFLNHTLAIAEVRTRLEEAAHARQLELLALNTEPDNWRTFVGNRGAPQILKPDLHAVTAKDDFEEHWFLEVDLGTESLVALQGKCHVYQEHYNSGREQAATGIYPVVTWLIADLKRRRALEALIRKDNRLDPQLFEVHHHDAFIDRATGQPTNRTNQPKGGTHEPRESTSTTAS